MEKTLKLILPVDLIDLMDKTVQIIGFKSRKNLVEVAVKRLLDKDRTLFKSANL